MYQLQAAFLKRQRVNVPQGLCCLMVCPQTFLIAYASRKDHKWALEFFHTDSFSDDNNFKTKLSSLVEQRGLKKVRTTWVLAPQDYQLLQTDTLPVPANEFQSAIRWKIKDMLRFPVEDLVIDQFPLPESKSTPKVMVVAAQMSYLQKRVEQIQDCGLSLSVIDIPELAIQNFAVFFENDTEGTGFIYIQNTRIQISISCEKNLYFTRSLEFPKSSSDSAVPEPGQDITWLATEIQRSFGYYMNQWRKPQPANILLISDWPASNDMITQLSQFLLLPVRQFDINQIIMASPQPLSDQQQLDYLPLLGELFRDDR
jgi:MSHA biogenesis protein MshI